MVLISEKGLVAVPEVDCAERDRFKEECEHKTGEYMSALVPYNSDFFDAHTSPSFEYTFSASTRYESPTTPGVVVDAFLSRDVNHDVTLHITSSTATIGDEIAEEELRGPEATMHIKANRPYAKRRYSLQRSTGGRSNWPLPAQSVEQVAAAHQSINEVLDKIAAANVHAYGTELPGLNR